MLNKWHKHTYRLIHTHTYNQMTTIPSLYNILYSMCNQTQKYINLYFFFCFCIIFNWQAVTKKGFSEHIWGFDCFERRKAHFHFFFTVLFYKTFFYSLIPCVHCFTSHSNVLTLKWRMTIIRNVIQCYVQIDCSTSREWKKLLCECYLNWNKKAKCICDRTARKRIQMRANLLFLLLLLEHIKVIDFES